jgi:flagellar motor switch protein FliM
MALERQNSKPEIAAQRRVLKLTPAIGDWTTYKPPRVISKRIKTGLYGFDRLSKEDVNTALFIHYRFLQNLLKQFKIDLSMAVELFTVQLEQTTYLNFLRNLSGPMVQCKIALPGVHDPIFFFLDLSLANSIINYALGSFDLEAISRGLTEAEKATLETTLNEYLPALCDAYAGTVANLSLSVKSSPDVTMEPTMTANTTLAAFGAEVSLADNPPAKLYIAYSGNALRTLLSAYKLQEKNRPLDFSRLPTMLLQKITAPVTAILGETDLTTQELNEFEVGDVVALDLSISSPLLTEVGNIKLSGQPGTKSKKVAIRIVGLREASDIELPPPHLATDKPEPKPVIKTDPILPLSSNTSPKDIKPEPSPLPPLEPENTLEEEEDWLADEDFTDEDVLGEEEFPPPAL